MSWRGLLATAAVTNAVMQVLFMVVAGVVIPPAVVLVSAQLLGLAVMTRFERTGAGITAVAAALQFAAYLSFALPGLAMVDSPLDFLDATVGFLTTVTMVVAGGALVRRRTGSPRRLALAGAMILGVAGAVATIGGLTATSDTFDPGEVEVAAEGYLWVPTELTAASDGTLHVDNRDPSHHILAIPALGLEVDLPGNTARDLPLDGAAPGVYDYVCPVPGHEAMTGTIEITE
jgi:hypothetical protein